MELSASRLVVTSRALLQLSCPLFNIFIIQEAAALIIRYFLFIAAIEVFEDTNQIRLKFLEQQEYLEMCL